jgi:Ankyrin repeats (many copies)
VRCPDACTAVRHAAILLDMDEPETLRATDSMAVALVAAIRRGDDESLSQILTERPELATTRLVDQCGVTRTPLHVVTDWPGYFPNAPRTVERLLAAGADPDATTTGGGQPETPLHWAASSDDLDVAHALIAGGASIDVPGGSIGTRWRTRSVTDVGTSPGSFMRTAPGSTSCGSPPGWACSRSSRNSSSRHRRPTAAISITRSGRPATADSYASRPTCWNEALTSTRPLTTTTPVPSRSQERRIPAAGY